MAVLLSILCYAFIGALDWALALFRMLACLKGWTLIIVSTVFLETLLSLIVFKNFTQTDDWFIALAYCTGASIGAGFVAHKLEAKPATEHVLHNCRCRRCRYTRRPYAKLRNRR